jgi:hypothetical protein
MRDKKRYIHSLYENAKAYMPDVAGTYIDIQDFIDGLPHPVGFDINIPIVDFLGLQAFDKWVKDFGELFLELYFSYRSLVVCSCSPSDVLDQKMFLEGDAVLTRSYAALSGSRDEYEHGFTQIEDEFFWLRADPIHRWGWSKPSNYELHTVPSEGSLPRCAMP